MAKAKPARITDVIGVLNQLCPPDLAEDWDNVGLQVGDPTVEVSKILLCLDAEETAIEEAKRCDAQLIIAHHPLIFRAIKRLSPLDMPGRILFQAIKENIAVASAHTNLDRAADGLNDWLAARLGLVESKPLEKPKTGQLYKLVVYVPRGHESAVMEAVFAAGAGQIGAYDRCSFRVSGTGSFRGNEDTVPFIGTAGEMEETEEVRLETIVPAANLTSVVNRMLKSHPYEEVAYDLIPLANQLSAVGLGRVGRLAQTSTLRNFADQVRSALNITSLRIVGHPDQKISKVAVCGGSGMSIYADAVRHGADCLVTGDIKFHEAQKARTEGMALIDAGHFATERIMVEELSRRMRAIFAERQFAIEVLELGTEEDPFVTLG